MVTSLNRRSPRSVWCVPHSKDWWEDVLRGKDNSWWKENLRMACNTFTVIRNELRPYIEREAAHLRQLDDLNFRCIFIVT